MRENPFYIPSCYLLDHLNLWRKKKSLCYNFRGINNHFVLFDCWTMNVILRMYRDRKVWLIARFAPSSWTSIFCCRNYFATAFKTFMVSIEVDPQFPFFGKQLEEPFQTLNQNSENENKSLFVYRLDPAELPARLFSNTRTEWKYKKGSRSWIHNFWGLASWVNRPLRNWIHEISPSIRP